MNRKQIAGIGCIALGVLFLVGALLLQAYNRWDSAQAGKASQNALAALEERIQSGTPSMLVPGETQPEGAAAPDDTASGESQEPRELTGVDIDGHEYVGYLTIPALERKLPVMKIVYLEDLQVAPCLQYGSPYTNDAVIAAHNYPSHFGPLRDFAGGEEIQFTDMQGETIHYTVKAVQSIEPTAVSEVTESEYDLVLYTCTTGGQARVMIGCERVNVIQ